MLFLAIVIKIGLVAIASLLSVSVLGLLGVTQTGHSVLTNYAPEVWLSLLALVFGTLIIVVSIASENTPRLVDMFVGDPWGRLYIWLIMLSSLENIYLQIVSDRPTIFFSNMIFINNYVLLPCFVLLAIPYTFYILKYTKNTNVIGHIYRENIHAVRSSDSGKPSAIIRNQLTLFATVNQLHDLLQYTQFKEPKGDIINRLGNSVRVYLKLKNTFPDSFFNLNEKLREDISFRTMREKYNQIEKDKIFYEQKVFKVIDAIYLLLIRESHYELASLCGNELLEIGRVAIRQNDVPATEAVIFHFNTIFRYGINHGLKTREIRNAYNTIYYYNQLIRIFIEQKNEDKIIACCSYFGLYADELTKLSATEPAFGFLIEAISWELKNNLELLCENHFSKDIQSTVLANITKLKTNDGIPSSSVEYVRNGLRLIKESLCLYYISRNNYNFVDQIANSILAQLGDLETDSLKQIIANDCEVIQSESEVFWEETDQGNRNIYYSREKNQIPKFTSYVFAKLENYQLTK